MIIRKAESKDIEKIKDTPLTIEEFRGKIMEAQKKMEAVPNAMVGHDADNYCPLKHSFGDGIYVREIFMPKGTLIISKIHKFNHPYFVLKGKASVLTEDGVKLVEAPFQDMTKAGTKRALYIHEDMTWTTVHATEEKDLDKIENEIIAKDFKGLDEFINKNIIEVKEVKELCHG